MGLRSRFNLVLVIVFTLGLTIAGVIACRLLHKNARDEVIAKAGVMMAGAIAIRGYTVDQVRPHLEAKLSEEFLPQSVPAYAATETFQVLREKYPEYIYKEATLNPTNPRDRAVDWEADIVQKFAADPKMDELIGERDTPSGRSLYLARPISINKEACLACHSTPDQAPQAMRVRYGDSNGFNWKLNEVVGAQIVSVPMSVPIKKANDVFYTFILLLTAIFMSVCLVLNLMLNRFIIKPLAHMSDIANQVSMGNSEIPEFDVSESSEISDLGKSFNRMRRSLEKAMQMLNG